MREVRPDQHGTSTGYTYGCRCNDCRSAQIANTRRWEAQRKAQPFQNHGTATTYGYGCRCEECRAAQAAKVRRARAANPKKYRETSRRWREANPHAQKAADQRWMESHPDETRARSVRSRNRRRAMLLDAWVEDFDYLEVFERDNWVCHICGKKVNRRLRAPHRLSVELDHVIPISAGVEKGGVHSRANTACSHRECNRWKAARIWDEELQTYI